MESFQIDRAETPDQIESVRVLFREYGELPGVRVCITGFDQEIESLPGQYAPPEGELLLATTQGEAAGCVALRRIGEEVCEMKRLYVRPRFRGEGLGRLLLEEALGAAFKKGYNRLCLDTLPDMRSAISLYQSYGFHRIPPYLDNPTPGAICFELRLA